MKLNHKLGLGFTLAAIVVAGISLMTANVGKRILEKTLEENAVMTAREVMWDIDRSLYHRMEEMHAYSKDLAIQRFLVLSNSEFKDREDLREYIDKQEDAWVRAPKEILTPFMENILSNDMSQEIRRKLAFYRDRYGYLLYDEIFVTNRFGFNVAQTNKTTDFKQSDEVWWQKAREDGIYIGDIEYDQSADIYSTNICVRVDGPQGQFLGVVKAVLNVRETINLIKEIVENSPYKSAVLKLATQEGDIVFSTENGISEISRDKVIKDRGEEYLSKGAKVFSGKRDGKFFARIDSKGYREYKGLGWAVIIEYDMKEVFAPGILLRNRLLLVSVIVIFILSIVFAYFVSRVISVPVKKLTKASVQIGGGNLDTIVDVVSNDELGDLAKSLNVMNQELKEFRDKMISSRDYADNIVASTMDSLIVIDSWGEIQKVNRATTNLLGYAQHELIGKKIASIFQPEEEQIIDEFEIPSMLISKDFRILNVNKAFTNLMGGSKDDVIGNYCYKVTHKRDDECQPPYDTCPIHEACEKNKSCVETHRHFDKDGGEVLVNVVAAPIFDDVGKVLYYLHVARKINEQTEQEKEVSLAAANELVKKLTTVVKKFGKDPVYSKSGLFQLIVNGTVKDVSIYYRNKSGEKIPVTFSSSEMKDKQGRMVGVVCVAKDMREMHRLMDKEKSFSAAESAAEVEKKKATEIEKAYQDLRKAKKMLIQSEKNAIVGNLSGEIAYKLNNPIGIILGSAQSALSHMKEEDPFFSTFRAVEREAIQCKGLVKELLIFSGKEEVAKVPLDINEVVDSAMFLIAVQAGLKGITIVKEYGKGLPKINGHKRMLQQVMLGLFNNAVNAMSERGILRLETVLKNDVVEIRISDTGAVISDEILEKIFEPSLSQKSEEVGGRQNLSLCYEMVSQHGGTIEAENFGNKGVVFIVRLPSDATKKEM